MKKAFQNFRFLALILGLAMVLHSHEAHAWAKEPGVEGMGDYDGTVQIKNLKMINQNLVEGFQGLQRSFNSLINNLGSNSKVEEMGADGINTQQSKRFGDRVTQDIDNENQASYSVAAATASGSNQELAVDTSSYQFTGGFSKSVMDKYYTNEDMSNSMPKKFLDIFARGCKSEGWSGDEEKVLCKSASSYLTRPLNIQKAATGGSGSSCKGAITNDSVLRSQTRINADPQDPCVQSMIAKTSLTTTGSDLPRDDKFNTVGMIEKAGAIIINKAKMGAKMACQFRQYAHMMSFPQGVTKEQYKLTKEAAEKIGYNITNKPTANEVAVIGQTAFNRIIGSNCKKEPGATGAKCASSITQANGNSEISKTRGAIRDVGASAPCGDPNTDMNAMIAWLKLPSTQLAFEKINIYRYIAQRMEELDDEAHAARMEFAQYMRDRRIENDIQLAEEGRGKSLDEIFADADINTLKSMPGMPYDDLKLASLDPIFLGGKFEFDGRVMLADATNLPPVVDGRVPSYVAMAKVTPPAYDPKEAMQAMAKMLSSF
jgi:hypothetical protein